MRFHIRRVTRPLAAFAFAATPALAGDFYVDAVHGNDANGGTSTLDAWRTITHAMTAIPPTPLVAHTIHVAPGTYGAATGEVFPLAMRPKIRLFGEAGSAATILAGPAPQILAYTSTALNGYTFDALSGAEGLTLRDAAQGIWIESTKGSSSPAFSDLLLEALDVGVHARGGLALGFAGGVDATFDRVTIATCGLGVDLQVAGSTLSLNSSSISFVDSTIRDCATDGVSAIAGALSASSVSLERCRVIGNGASGVAGMASHGFDFASRTTVTARNTLFARNGDSGVRMHAELTANVTLHAEHCTFAHNGQHGAFLDVTPNTSSGTSAFFWNSILSGHGTDLTTSFLDAHYSDAADGSMLGEEGCVAADAGFVDPANGDFRLAFGSPCIDTAALAFMLSPDLLGRARPLDGDLDTVAVPDMGAMEFAPLAVAGHAPGDTRLLLAISGPSYGRSILYLSDAPLLLTPEATPFGSFFLVRSTAVVIPIARIQSRASNLIELKIPALAVPGSTVSLQALIRSQLSPAGAAFSNPLEFVIAP